MCYRLWVIHCTVRHWWTERLPFWIAWHLPRRVAYLAFFRVYGAWGQAGPDLVPVCDAWEGRKPSARVDEFDTH
jgi:hypothetical protein